MPSDRDHPAVLAVVRRCLDLYSTQFAWHRHHEVIRRGLDREQHVISAQHEPCCREGSASLSQMPEIWLEPARFGYDWNVASEVAEIEAQTDRVALDVSPRVPVVVRQAKRYQ